MGVKATKTLDTAAKSLLALSAIDNILSGLVRRRDSKPIRPKADSGIKLYYGLVGAAAAYSLARTFGLKTKKEKRLNQLADIYEQAGEYQKRATGYSKSASEFVRHKADEARSLADKIQSRISG